GGVEITVVQIERDQAPLRAHAGGSGRGEFFQLAPRLGAAIGGGEQVRQQEYVFVGEPARQRAGALDGGLVLALHRQRAQFDDPRLGEIAVELQRAGGRFARHAHVLRSQRQARLRQQHIGGGI